MKTIPRPRSNYLVISLDGPRDIEGLSMKVWIGFVIVIASLFLRSNLVLSEEGWKADPALVAKLSAKQSEFNYDESRVPQYTLPDPLRMLDGEMVTTAAQWPSRREETMELFRANVYGRRPQTDYRVTFETVAQKEHLFDSQATGRSMLITITVGKDKYSFPMFVFLPARTGQAGGAQAGGAQAGGAQAGGADGRLPAVIHINNRQFPTFEAAATVDDEFWPVRDLLKRGYVACAVSTVTIDPDRADGFDEGIRGFFHRASGQGDKPPADDAWKALSAWGWGASRALDHLLTLDQVDPKKIAVIGHSRGGKTALWAAAEDTRFAIACSNNSGCGGAALSRRMYGETIARITHSFPHWFCDRLNTYVGRESELPVDQHQLFGLIAPRPVYATSAAEDLWADPRGEYLSMVAAAPVYRLLGEKAFESSEMPPLGKPRIEGKMGYHIREGGHGLTGYDWNRFLDFCDAQWRR